jgi:hypothetical protein
MPQPRFETLSTTLLRAGIAPRHVHRYVAELRDHFDDLVREEVSKGHSRDSAEAAARARLGDEHGLAEVALSRPELRSLTSRYPWAVFGLGPVALLSAALATTLLIEIAIFSLIGHTPMRGDHRPPPEWAMSIVAAWNALPTLIAPLAIAGLLWWIGVRQHIATRWIVIGVVLTCVLGAFQQVTFTDDGVHGELSLAMGLFPPFPRDVLAAGIWRAVANLVLCASLWWLVSRRQNASAREAAPSRS